MSILYIEASLFKRVFNMLQVIFFSLCLIVIGVLVVSMLPKDNSKKIITFIPKIFIIISGALIVGLMTSPHSLHFNQFGFKADNLSIL